MKRRVSNEQMFNVAVTRGAFTCGCGEVMPRGVLAGTRCLDCDLPFTLWSDDVVDIDGVEMAASYQPAEPDVGIMQGYFEPQYAQWWDAEARKERDFLLTEREESDALEGEEPDDGADAAYEAWKEARWAERDA